MRWPVLLLVVFFVPMGQALVLDVLPDPIIIEDAVGDVQGQPSPAGAPDYVDLTRIELALLEDSFQFEVEVASVDALTNVEGMALQTAAWVEFTARDTQFLMALIIQPEPLEAEGQPLAEAPARIYRLEGDAWVEKALLPSEDDRPNGAYSTSVPLDLLRDADDFPVRPGDVIVPTHVQSRWGNAQIFFDPNSDPQGGNAPQQIYEDVVDVPADAVLPLDVDDVGPILISTPVPVQFSNGGGSFHWPLEVRSNVQESLAVDMHFEAPDGVQVYAPAYFELPAGAVTTMDVYASLPFAHSHGKDIQLEVQLRSGQMEVTLPLAVKFLDIPQPAGHHNTVYVHGTQGGSLLAPTDPGMGNVRGAWISTQVEEPDSTAQYIQPSPVLCDPEGEPRNGVHWSIPLRPALLIGIDGDVSRDIQIDGQMAYAAPLEGKLYTRLARMDSWEYELQTADEWTRVTRHTLGDVFDVSGAVPLPPEFDRIAPTSDMQNMGIAFTLCPVDNPAPLDWNLARLYTGMAIELPFDEYQASLEFATSKSSITLHADETATAAAPGATVLWTVSATTDAQYQLTLPGPGAHQFQLHGPALRTGDSTFQVWVTVPDDAMEGDLIQAILHASNVNAPADSTALPLAITVDPSASRDDTALLPTSGEGKQAPGLGAWAVPAILAAAVLVGRRRLA